jgi:PilZ domain
MYSIGISEADLLIACNRSYGRADLSMRTKLDVPSGRINGIVQDLSLGGAKIEVEQPIEVGSSLWLELHKLKVFGIVRWARGNVIGVQFDVKLPKAFILSLRGETVDPEELRAVETILAARNWVMGSPSNRSKSLRLADVLGSRSEHTYDGSHASVPGRRPSSSGRHHQLKAAALNKRAFALVTCSALIGGLLGIGSVFLS